MPNITIPCSATCLITGPVRVRSSGRALIVMIEYFLLVLPGIVSWYSLFDIELVMLSLYTRVDEACLSADIQPDVTHTSSGARRGGALVADRVQCYAQPEDTGTGTGRWKVSLYLCLIN